MSRLATLVVLPVFAAFLWWCRAIAADYAMFGGTLAFGLDVAASLITAAICVVSIGELMAGFAIPVLFGVPATGFGRAAIYALLGIAALGAVLGHFGVNIAAVVTTSAVLTAVIGISLQRTLAAMIAGFSLQTDRILKIGDAIVRDGEAMTVLAIGWRSITARKECGTLVVLVNSNITDGTTEIWRRGAPIRREVSVSLPLEVAPGRVEALIEAILADVVLVEADRPIAVEPISYDPERALTRYRIRYWVRGFEDRDLVGERMMASLWYALQRDGIAWPIPDGLQVAAGLNDMSSPEWRSAVQDAIVQVKAEHHSSPNLTDSAITDSGTLLLYGTGERVILPERVKGDRCILLKGRLEEGASRHLPLDTTMLAEDLYESRRMTLQKMTARLSEHIGPFAELAVRRAGDAETDLVDVRAKVADELEDERARAAFMASVPVRRKGRYSPGFIFGSRRLASGFLQSDPLLLCDGSVAIVAVPERLFQVDDQEAQRLKV